MSTLIEVARVAEEGGEQLEAAAARNQCNCTKLLANESFYRSKAACSPPIVKSPLYLVENTKY